jgi:predicted 3-demethylubiquinone-9 3-methyltransferase (glyoxalase superfamily)
MTVHFEIEGQPFIALNGGPPYRLDPAISFQVDCKTQDEVDHLWSKLSDGGQTLQCGWGAAGLG